MSERKKTIQWDNSKSLSLNLSNAVRLAVLHQAKVELTGGDNSYICNPDGTWQLAQPEETPMK